MDISKRLSLVMVVSALVLSTVALVLTLTGCCGGDASGSQTGRTSAVIDEDLRAGYSQAVRYGDLIWTAGHLPQSASPGDDIAKQTRAVMDGLETTLRKADASFDTVVMTHVYLTDFDDWDAFNNVYRQYFDNHLPPRVTVEVGGLAFGNIEISMVAHTGTS